MENIIIHCGSDVTACQTLLAIDYAGLAMPKLFVGSWGMVRNDKDSFKWSIYIKIFAVLYFLKIYLILKLDENKKIYGPIVIKNCWKMPQRTN
jgi:hypothetical protein